VRNCFTSKNYNKLSNPEKMLLSLSVLISEVNNGGLDQYFGNTEGKQALDVQRFLQLIGADNMAAIFKQALELFPDSLRSGLTKGAWKVLDDNQDFLDESDSRFYACEDDIPLLAMRYLNQNS